jgi:uncharacterized protein with FMN-binding domain
MNTDRRIKIKRKFKVSLIIFGILVLVLCISGKVGWSMLEKEHNEAANLQLDNIDFSKLNDGTYVAEYDGGMFGWRSNKVRVIVENGSVVEIKLLETVDDAPTQAQKDELFKRVIDGQSLQVDTISGATLTSNGYLQGVENALIKALKE